MLLQIAAHCITKKCSRWREICVERHLSVCQPFACYPYSRRTCVGKDYHMIVTDNASHFHAIVVQWWCASGFHIILTKRYLTSNVL